MQYGWREGRDPSASFKTLFYRDFHLDGAETNPLTHYVEAGGAASGLPTAPASESDFIGLQRVIIGNLFDPAYYRLQLESWTADLLGDYLSHGWKQGRSPSTNFDVTRYGERFQFMRTLGINPLYHHASQLRMKSRRNTRFVRKTSSAKVSRATIVAAIKPAFDADYYLRANADVRLKKLDPIKHFIDFGWREGRNPTALFDIRSYSAENDDIGEMNPFYHYVTIGHPEGRRGNPIGTRLYPADGGAVRSRVGGGCTRRRYRHGRGRGDHSRLQRLR